MEEDNFDESLEEEANSREETEEELENIIEETEPTSFRQIALEEILPTLKERETQTLEQGVANIIINKEEENNEEEPGIYDLQQSRLNSSYGASSDYKSSSSAYDTNQSPERGIEMGIGSDQNPRLGGIQEERNQGFQQKQYEADFEKKLKEDKKSW